MRIMSNQEIRRMLENAFHEGRVRGKWESSPPFNEFGGYDREPKAFDEWYEDVYEGPDCE